MTIHNSDWTLQMLGLSPDETRYYLLAGIGNEFNEASNSILFASHGYGGQFVQVCGDSSSFSEAATDHHIIRELVVGVDMLACVLNPSKNTETWLYNGWPIKPTPRDRARFVYDPATAMISQRPL